MGARLRVYRHIYIYIDISDLLLHIIYNAKLINVILTCISVYFHDFTCAYIVLASFLDMICT